MWQVLLTLYVMGLLLSQEPYNPAVFYENWFYRSYATHLKLHHSVVFHSQQTFWKETLVLFFWYWIYCLTKYPLLQNFLFFVSKFQLILKVLQFLDLVRSVQEQLRNHLQDQPQLPFFSSSSWFFAVFTLDWNLRGQVIPYRLDPMCRLNHSLQ